MNQRRIKKCAKQCESRRFKAQEHRRIIGSLPQNRKIVIGKTSVTIPYVDNMKEINSMESQNAPIVLRYKPKKAARIFSRILKTTGIGPLAEIGDIITGKY